jgi:hypothetical protein
MALVIVMAALVMVLPFAGEIFDYGSEGWLWALFGLCQRMYVEGRVAVHKDVPGRLQAESALLENKPWGRMRLLACVVAAVIYIWQEQIVFFFSQAQLALVLSGIGVLSIYLCSFQRGPSRYQPREPFAAVLRYLGRHTLEIYAFQLAGSELIILFFPDLAA